MKHNIATSVPVFLFAFLFAALGAAGSAHAFMVRTGSQVTVPKGEAVNETLIVSGQAVAVDADVNGDIICAGQIVTISGNVNGDVLCVGQNVTIANSVGGSVRVAGQSVQLNGSIGRNVTAAGQTVALNSAVGEEMLFAAESAAINGQIAKSIAGAASSINVNAKIGGNAQFYDANLTLQKDAAIGGSLVYTSNNDAVREDGAQVGGSVTRNMPPAPKRQQKSAQMEFWGWLAKLIVYLIVALILARFFKGSTLKAVDAMLAKPWRSLGWGALILILAPIIAVAFAITLVGVPVALLLIVLLFAAIFFSRIFAAIAAARWFTRRFWKSRQESLVIQALVGVVALWVFFAIPDIGGIFSLAAVVWGLGGINYLFRRKPAAIQS